MAVSINSSKLRRPLRPKHLRRRRRAPPAAGTGHVLGLDHETTRCARMNPTFDHTGTPTYCKQHSLTYWLAHPLTSDDLRGLRAIYSFQ